MLMALRFEPSRFFLKRQIATLPLRKNLLGLKRKAINIYFELKSTSLLSLLSLDYKRFYISEGLTT